jgi:hypothetical protein
MPPWRGMRHDGLSHVAAARFIVYRFRGGISPLAPWQSKQLCHWHKVGFPPPLLDELARLFARVALDRFLEESAAREPRQDDGGSDFQSQQPVAPDHQIHDK